eukprot:scaffold109099_cov20-Tisochrysis_lutea.AAC.1
MLNLDMRSMGDNLPAEAKDKLAARCPQQLQNNLSAAFFNMCLTGDNQPAETQDKPAARHPQQPQKSVPGDRPQ